MGSNGNKDTLLYLIYNTSSNGILYGRKKLTKLGFFAEHWDPERDLLLPKKQLDDFNFMIYTYGPFSKQLFAAFDQLKDDGLIKETRRPNASSKIVVTDSGIARMKSLSQDLPADDKRQIESVSDRFGEYGGGKLEDQSLEYLGIDKDEKQDHMGLPIEVLISEKS